MNEICDNKASTPLTFSYSRYLLAIDPVFLIIMKLFKKRLKECVKQDFRSY